MVRPIDVEPLNRDTLVLLQTDFPAACDAAPQVLISGPEQWTLVDKFCFFSGGPINTEEDVYYQADFDGNPIYMLAFLSPSLTPSELYKLDTPYNDPGLKSAAAVEEVESVYDLTDRDFEDLKLYHLGPCRALYVFQSWPSHRFVFLTHPAGHNTYCSLKPGPRYFHLTSSQQGSKRFFELRIMSVCTASRLQHRCTLLDSFPTALS